MSKYKTFLDTVHGYITVPEEYCDLIIDTPNFQRLRRIEQLSSRSLFPCARHDRFVHSLGVYHMGTKFVAAIERNSPEIVSDKLKQTFFIACLLHDVGHSPFSHTLEFFFGDKDYLFDKYKEAIDGDDVEIEHIQLEKTDVKEHEILSALLCITTYHDAIVSLNGDPALVGRMIMGFQYKTPDKSIEDCFISLLHGDIIDTDKFDYICRDKWASGYQSNSVDIERVINSIHICLQDGKYQIAYSKNALYEIKALFDNKNFQNNWVFNHHQVVYEQRIFKQAVSELIECLKVGKTNLFDYRSFYQCVDVCEGVSVYMISDDDIVSLMKSHKEEIPHFNEWFSRKYMYFPIWKTYSEMNALLGKDVSDKILRNEGKVYGEIENMLRETFGIKVFSEKATPSTKVIKEKQVHIYFGEDKIMDFKDFGLVPEKNAYEGLFLKYIFVEKKNGINRDACIEAIKDFCKD